MGERKGANSGESSLAKSKMQLSAEEFEVVLKNWRKNIPILYDAFVSHKLDVASGAFDWGRIVEASLSNTTQALYYALPNPSATYDQKIGQWSTTPSTLIMGHIRFPNPGWSDSRSLTRSTGPSIKVKKRISHPGEICSIRQCPQHADLVATQTHSPEVYIWNVRTQPSKRAKREAVPEATGDADSKAGDRIVRSSGSSITSSMADLTLTGHEGGRGEYRALEFSRKSPLLMSGGSDKSVCVWSLGDVESLGLSDSSSGGENVGDKRKRQDLEASCQASSTHIRCRDRFIGHVATIEDVSFHPENDHILTATARNGVVLFWDRRKGSDPVHSIHGLSKAAITAVDWNPTQPHHILTGSRDSRINLLDLRALGCYPSFTEIPQVSHLPSDAKPTPIPNSSNDIVPNLNSDGPVNKQNGGAKASDEGATDMSGGEARAYKNGTGGPGLAEGKNNHNLPDGLLASRFLGHTRAISRVQWSPFSPTVFASSTCAGEMCIWDSSGENYVRQSLGDGFPPSLIFRHIGHRGGISSFMWNPDSDWTLATLADDRLSSSPTGTLHVWRLSELLSRPPKDATRYLQRMLPSIQ